MTADIVLYVEHDHGSPKRTALEAAAKSTELASELQGRVTAIALGEGASACATQLARNGVQHLLCNDDSVFDEYLLDPHVDVLTQVITDHKPSVVLLPDTPSGRDLAARVAARVGAALVSAVVDLRVRDGHVDAYQTVFGGQYTTQVEVTRSPTAIFLVRPNAFRPQENLKEVEVETLHYVPNDGARRARLGAKTEEEGAPTPLEEASIIVSGGRGLGGPEPFALLEELARELGGVVGASRAAVDAGWIPYSHQIGQTGRTVKPELYLAFGISGAVQHRVGMQTAETIVAVNRDSDAPIFQMADLAVVGDLFAIVPKLTEEIRRRKGATP